MPEIFTQEQVVQMLMTRQRTSKLSQRAFALTLGIHETALSAIYAQRILPSRIVLRYLKLRVQKSAPVYERIRK